MTDASADRTKTPELTGELIARAREVLSSPLTGTKRQNARSSDTGSSSPGPSHRAGMSKKRATDATNTGVEKGGMIVSKRACKPFKAPSGSRASTPIGSARTGGKVGQAPPSIRVLPSPAATELATLERRSHVLRQALSILQEEKSQKLEALDAKWIAAGRIVVERLWQVSNGPAGDPRLLNPDNGSLSTSNDISKSWGWQRDEDDASAVKKAPRRRPRPDEDFDEPEEDEGAYLPTVEEFRAEVEAKMIKGLKEGKSYLGLLDGPRWDMGEMLRRQGVDPSLLGWDAKEQDWKEELEYVSL